MNAELWYWQDKANAFEREIERLEREVADLENDNEDLTRYQDVNQRAFDDLRRERDELKEQVELMSKRDVLAEVFIMVAQQNAELLGLEKPKPVGVWTQNLPPSAPEGVDIRVPNACTCGRAANQYMGHHKTSCPKSLAYLPEPSVAPVREGAWGTFSHCGRDYLHSAHTHAAIFNEGPTADLHCSGDGKPRGT